MTVRIHQSSLSLVLVYRANPKKKKQNREKICQELPEQRRKVGSCYSEYLLVQESLKSDSKRKGGQNKTFVLIMRSIVTPPPPYLATKLLSIAG